MRGCCGSYSRILKVCSLFIAEDSLQELNPIIHLNRTYHDALRLSVLATLIFVFCRPQRQYGRRGTAASKRICTSSFIYLGPAHPPSILGYTKALRVLRDKASPPQTVIGFGNGDNGTSHKEVPSSVRVNLDGKSWRPRDLLKRKPWPEPE